MPISFYEAGPRSYLRTLGAVSTILERGASHFPEAGIDLAEIVETRLHPDMAPLRFQIVSVVHHSVGALEGIRAGVFRPPGDKTPYDYAGLRRIVTQAHQTIEAISPEDLGTLEGKDVTFEAGEARPLFTAEGFLLSFSLPSFYFHATTAYDILRMKGMKLVKRDYLGAIPLKG